jgi:hypothetical protein
LGSVLHLILGGAAVHRCGNRTILIRLQPLRAWLSLKNDFSRNLFGTVSSGRRGKPRLYRSIRGILAEHGKEARNKKKDYGEILPIQASHPAAAAHDHRGRHNGGGQGHAAQIEASQSSA